MFSNLDLFVSDPGSGVVDDFQSYHTQTGSCPDNPAADGNLATNGGDARANSIAALRLKAKEHCDAIATM